MKQLFDETFSDNRTLWYSFFTTIEQPNLIETICQIIKKDLQKANEVKATSWIFYREDKQKDALAEEVRSSLMVQLVDEHYYVQYNMSDYEFVTQREAISTWLKQLDDQLKDTIV